MEMREALEAAVTEQETKDGVQVEAVPVQAETTPEPASRVTLSRA